MYFNCCPLEVTSLYNHRDIKCNAFKILSSVFLVSASAIAIAAYFCPTLWQGGLPPLSIRVTLLSITLFTTAVSVTAFVCSCLHISRREFLA